MSWATGTMPAPNPTMAPSRTANHTLFIISANEHHSFRCVKSTFWNAQADSHNSFFPHSHTLVPRYGSTEGSEYHSSWLQAASLKNPLRGVHDDGSCEEGRIEEVTWKHKVTYLEEHLQCAHLHLFLQEILPKRVFVGDAEFSQFLEVVECGAGTGH